LTPSGPTGSLALKVIDGDRDTPPGRIPHLDRFSGGSSSGAAIPLQNATFCEMGEVLIKSLEGLRGVPR
jgi:hypothetical protein